MDNLDRRQAYFQDLRRAHIVLVEKALQCRSTSAFDLNQGRPPFNESAEQWRIDAVEPLQRLWIILFQSVSQSIGNAYPVIHQAPSLFH